ncbi:hypothetical protein [Streptomyces natalensis]|uniref:hypothetical protein n=1 Tax=Streptomyces natalensis TaxID=68242 RepID=UPI001F51EA34|nr:hypothetical protein [Streptomyces natalensis]
MREAQARLDEAQADRSRVLAAFAVTVGSTGAVAGLFGLNEREVRIARRTVGKDDARAVAEQLLAAAPNAAPRETDTATPAPDTSSEQTPDAAPSSYSSSSGTRPTATPRESRDTAASSSEPSWSAALDAVLVGSWQTGVDLRELATEFGLDFNRLLTRAQQLAAQGRFHHAPGQAGETYGGRHRRGDLHESECTIPAQQTAAWNATAPSGHGMASAWHPGAAQPAETVADMSTLAPDWDSALAPWGTITQPPYQEPEPAHQPWTQYHLSS